MNSHTKEDAESVKRRLRRIGGQIAGIEKMVDGGRGCMEVLTQISSAIGALQGLWGKIMERHLRVCISSAVLSGDKKLVDELVEYLKKVHHSEPLDTNSFTFLLNGKKLNINSEEKIKDFIKNNNVPIITVLDTNGCLKTQ